MTARNRLLFPIRAQIVKSYDGLKTATLSVILCVSLTADEREWIERSRKLKRHKRDAFGTTLLGKREQEFRILDGAKQDRQEAQLKRHN